MARLRILHLCIRYPPAPGGVETHVQEIGRRLVARGHEVTVFTSDLLRELPFERLSPDTIDSADYETRRRDGIAVERFRARTLADEAHYVVLRGLVRALLRARPDVVHAHTYGMAYTHAAALVRRLQGVPFVFTTHFHPSWSMMMGPRRQRLRHLYDRALGPGVLRSTDLLISNSQEESRYLTALGADPRRIRIITSGIDDDLPQRTPDPGRFRDRYGIRGPLVLYAGRLSSNKGLAVLLESAPAILKEVPDATVAFVGGDFGVGPALQRQAERLGLGDRVLFTGHIAGAELYRSAYDACDLFVLPSEWEAFGIVLAEAMAAGKPCVAADRGGMPTLVVEGRTGHLVPYGDPKALSKAILQLLQDPDRGRSMGAAGRDRVLARFTWSRVVDSVESVYRTVCADRNG